MFMNHNARGILWELLYRYGITYAASNGRHAIFYQTYCLDTRVGILMLTCLIILIIYFVFVYS